MESKTLRAMRKLSTKCWSRGLVFIGLIGLLYMRDLYSSTSETKPCSDQGFSHPLLVIGILSDEKGADKRMATRNTWISTAFRLRHLIPFRIVYKFVLDQPSKLSLEENKLYNDIMYINVTHHGYGNKFGEKVYHWYKYAYQNYPDALLTARLDDDVFLCVPEVFDRLNAVKSPTLYYGWKSYEDTPSYLDEMFMVLGRNLVKRIAERKYCGERKCARIDDLIDTNYASTSVMKWFEKYKDVDTVADNPRIIHFRRGKAHFDRHKHLITGMFCNKYIAFHKALPPVMYKMQNLRTNNSELSTSFDAPSAATGAIFSGNIIRPRIESSVASQNNIIVGNNIRKIRDCPKWAVVSTISHPTQAIREISMFSDWCMVIVADEKTPSKSKFLDQLSIKENHPTIIYLSVSEQHTLYPLLSHIIPVNSIGRKNIGYMYAIQNKAKMIWDFDDDNIGIIDTQVFEPTANKNSYYVKACENKKTKLVNPYPYFGVNETRTWPRGFPLQSLKDNETIPQICNITDKLNIGVIQSLANVQPDVDAVYRFTRELPLQFSATTKSHQGLVIPLRVFSPFNAQATLWFSSAFEYLALPISINGRVSDIWRSYIAQYFLHKNNVHIAFSTPFVKQDRNPHSLIKDFNAELDIYQKSDRLLDFLSTRKVSEIQNNLDVLYDDLYMRNYFHAKDVEFVKAWLKTLSAVKIGMT